MVTRVFPRFMQLAWFLLEFLSALGYFSFLLIYFGFAFTILSLKALYMSALIKTELEYSPYYNRYYYFFTYVLSYFVQGSSLFSKF